MINHTLLERSVSHKQHPNLITDRPTESRNELNKTCLTKWSRLKKNLKMQHIMTQCKKKQMRNCQVWWVRARYADAERQVEAKQKASHLSKLMWREYGKRQRQMKNKVQERKLTGHGEVEQNNTGQRQKPASINTQRVYWGQRGKTGGKQLKLLGNTRLGKVKQNTGARINKIKQINVAQRK